MPSVQSRVILCSIIECEDNPVGQETEEIISTARAEYALKAGSSWTRQVRPTQVCIRWIQSEQFRPVKIVKDGAESGAALAPTETTNGKVPVHAVLQRT